MESFVRKITLVLADDEPVARSGIRSMLLQAGDIEIVGEAQDGNQAMAMVADLRPNILLLDLIMPGPRPREVEEWIRKNIPETATLVLTAHHRSAYLAAMMDAGVAGYLQKSASAEALIDAIRIAAGGVIRFSEEQKEEAAHWRKEAMEKWNSLSERERETAQLVKVGASNKFIAEELSIGIKTVQEHLSNVFRKLGVESRTQVAVWMINHDPDKLDK